MINYLTIALTHALIALAAIRLLMRDDLDKEDEGPKPLRPWQKKPADTAGGEG